MESNKQDSYKQDVAREALDTIVEADPRYRWQLVDEVVNLLPADGEPALLNTRISKFRVTDVTSALDALSQLLALPEVKKRYGGSPPKTRNCLDQSLVIT